VSFAAFAHYAEQVFAARPHVRSVLLALVHNYDGARATLAVASERTVPVWPHRCTTWFDDENPWIAGETCERCYAADRNETVPQLGLAVDAIAAFVHPVNEDDEYMEVSAPVAVVERGKRVAILGQLFDPKSELRGAAPALPFDRRALELLDQIAAEPADDGLRRVLADHLLECGDPRGEYIALALDVGERTADTVFDPSWIAPLGAVVPAPCARFARGLLASVDVWAHDEDAIAAVRGAVAWRTVETLRFLPGSRTDVLDVEMRALRDVGPLDDAGLARLARLAVRERIERLVANVDEPAQLARIELPRLRELVISCARERLASLARAAWWRQLDRLTLVEADARRPPPELAEPPPCIAIATGAAGLATGWQLAYRRDGAVEVTLAGWAATASFAALRVLLGGVPNGRRVVLAPSPYYVPDRAEAQLLSRTCERPVDIAP